MYEIVMQKDLSHAGAKRYNARVITKITQREKLREIAVEATNRLRRSNYYRDDIVRRHFKRSPADVVWLNFVRTEGDIAKEKWILLTQWINPLLAKNMRPLESEYDEIFKGVRIKWVQV